MYVCIYIYIYYILLTSGVAEVLSTMADFADKTLEKRPPPSCPVLFLLLLLLLLLIVLHYIIAYVCLIQSNIMSAFRSALAKRVPRPTDT